MVVFGVVPVAALVPVCPVAAKAPALTATVCPSAWSDPHVYRCTVPQFHIHIYFLFSLSCFYWNEDSFKETCRYIWPIRF